MLWPCSSARCKSDTVSAPRMCCLQQSGKTETCLTHDCAGRFGPSVGGRGFVLKTTEGEASAGYNFVERCRIQQLKLSRKQTDCAEVQSPADLPGKIGKTGSDGGLNRVF